MIGAGKEILAAVLVICVCFAEAGVPRTTTEASPGEKADIDLDETVLEVEKYLKEHPELPPLSREEIIEYIHNISETDEKPSNPELEESAMIVLPQKDLAIADGGNIQSGTAEIPEENPRPYPVYRPEPGEDYATTTQEAMVSYTNYNDAEMVTKRYNFEGVKKSEYSGQPSNHRFLEDPPLEAIKEPIVVLPMKEHTYSESTTPTNYVTVSKPTKSIHRKKIKPTTEDSLENFGLDESKPSGKLKKGSRRKVKTTTEAGLNVKDLLKNLDTTEKKPEIHFQEHRVGSPHPTVNPEAYSVFRPIPIRKKIGNPVDSEMKTFLASFGLVPEEGHARQQKALNQEYLESMPDLNLEIIPEDMRDVIRDLGLVGESSSRRSRDSESKEAEKLEELLEKVRKIASLNESEGVSEELQKEVAEKVRLLKEGDPKTSNIREIIKANEEKFRFISSGGKRSGKRLSDGPDPLLSDVSEELKNEVKRQVSSSSSASSSSSSSSEAGSSGSESTTTESVNVEGLRASFGGGETASDDADIDSALPSKKPNGFYFLVDWNSFLEVGTEDDKRRVNIRFQPKAGDGRHFLPVNVP